jgi:hypothetical protein
MIVSATTFCCSLFFMARGMFVDNSKNDCMHSTQQLHSLTHSSVLSYKTTALTSKESKFPLRREGNVTCRSQDEETLSRDEPPKAICTQSATHFSFPRRSSIPIKSTILSLSSTNLTDQQAVVLHTTIYVL